MSVPGEAPKHSWFPWVLIVLLSAFAILPALLYPIEEHSYDAATFHVYRGVLFSAARAEGIPYPRWIQPINAGLGGPLFNFYPPLTYYALDILHGLGLSHPIAWRVVVALAIGGAAIGMFALGLSLSGGTWGALAASMSFAYAFPFLRELFERGSPQGFALALYPWALWGLVRLIQAPSGRRLALASLAWAALILTHHLSALFLVPLAGLLALVYVCRYRWPALIALALTIGLGILLSASFVVPFVAERPFVQMDNAVALDYARILENAIPLDKLLRLPPAYDTGLDNNIIGDHLGPLPAWLALAGVLAGPLLWRRRRHWEAALAMSLGLFGLAVIGLQTAGADPFWRLSPVLAYVQIRTRLLGLVILSGAMIAGLLIGRLKGRGQAIAAWMVIIASVILALPVLYPHLQHRYVEFGRNPSVSEVAAFSLRENVPGLTAFNEFLPIWRHRPFTNEEAERAGVLLANPPAGSRILLEERHNAWAEVTLDAPQSFDAILHLLFFPGWAGYVDGEPRELQPMEGSGYTVLASVPAGTHTITLRYEGTRAQRIGTALSISAAVVVILVAVLWRGKASPSVALAHGKANGWLMAGVVLALAVKTLWLDPHTTFLRRASTCAHVEGRGTLVQVRFGNSLRLCAVNAPAGSLRAGKNLKITLYWMAEQPVMEPAHSFVHVLGTTFNPETGNPLWGQQDKQLPGYHPVTRWVPGKLYRDEYEFPVAAGAPAGEYMLEIGWVQPATGSRLKPEMIQAPETMSISPLDSLLIAGIVISSG